MNIIINLTFCTWRSIFLCGVHHKLTTCFNFSQVEIGLAPFTPQMDAPGAVSVSYTKLTSSLTNIRNSFRQIM